MRAKRCPYFNCINVKKIGIRNGKQRYYCHGCNRSWASKPRPKRLLDKLWYQYTEDSRTVKSLAKEYSKSLSWVNSQLRLYEPPQIAQKPRTVTIIMDVTYFKNFGLLVAIDPFANYAQGENTVLYYAVLNSTERTLDYEVATDTIESMGYSIITITIDGRRGVRNMLEGRGIPVQLCQFHQLMTITRCLTKRPRIIQNIELRAIAMTLARSDEATFEATLADWYERHGLWLKERDVETNRYSHERTRRAYFSLVRNLPNLFTYQADYLQKDASDGRNKTYKVANTTSPLDGRFGAWKSKLKQHRGASKQRTITILCSLFSRTTD